MFSTDLGVDFGYREEKMEMGMMTFCYGVLASEGFNRLGFRLGFGFWKVGDGRGFRRVWSFIRGRRLREDYDGSGFKDTVMAVVGLKVRLWGFGDVWIGMMVVELSRTSSTRSWEIWAC